MNKNLSVCILLKDNYSNLLSCLDSIKDIADEIIIINASGQALEHSRVFPTNEFSIYTKIIDYNWNDDFSGARNAGLKEVTCQWVLSLDANDTVGNPRDILPYLNSPNDFFFIKFFEKHYSISVNELKREFENKWWVSLKNELQAQEFENISLNPMLIKNDKSLKYQGRIYETLSGIDSHDNKDIFSEKIAEIKVHHNFISKEQQINETKITESILLTSISENTELKLFYRAKLLSLKLQQFQAIKQNIIDEIIEVDSLIDSVEDKTSFEFFYADVIDYLVNEKSEYVPILLNKALEIFPMSLYIHFNLYYLFLLSGKIPEAIKTLIFMLNHDKPFLYSKFPARILDPDYLNVLIATTYFELGDYEAFDFYFKKLDNFNKYETYFNNFRDSLDSHLNILSLLTDALSETTISYFRLAREYLREIMFEKAKNAYLNAIKFSFKEDYILMQKMIFADMLLHAKELNIDDELISELFSEGKTLSENFSYFWYCSGKFYLDSEQHDQAKESFLKAKEIEEANKNINLINNVDDIMNLSPDPFTYKLIKENLELLNNQTPILVQNDEYWSRKEFQNALNHYKKTGEITSLSLMKRLLTDSLESDSMKVIDGMVWPTEAFTMLGIKRIDNVLFCVEDVIKNKIKGDLIETGVWKGGTTIFMRAILKFHNVTDKKVYVADSFEGLPKPDKSNPIDSDSKFHEQQELAVSIDEVKDNFKKFGMLDEQVVFLKGWFKDTLKEPPFEKLSVLRLDGDLYSSTWDSLTNLYDKVSIGGYIIVDDYSLKGCKAAIDEFRSLRNITEPFSVIDWSSIYWQKTKP